MRSFINIVNEAKLVDGVFTAILPRDLPRLIANGDLRGCAVDDKVYCWNAYDDTHYGMRARLGLHYEAGFSFFVAPVSEYREDQDYRDEAGEKAEGREDWMFGPPNFEVGDVGIWTDMNSDDCLTNMQFARMVGE